MTVLSFIKATLERAVKTFAQVLGALLAVSATDLLNTDWTANLSVAAMAAVLSVLTSIASAPFGGTGPSLSNEVISPPAVDPGTSTPEVPKPRTDAGYGLVETVVVVLVIVLLVLVILRIA